MSKANSGEHKKSDIPLVVFFLVLKKKHRRGEQIKTKERNNKTMANVKIVVMGMAGVGKSSLTVQFVQNIFLKVYDPTIEDSYRKPVEVDGKIYTVEILDTAGTEQFSAMRDLYMRTGDGFMLVYSAISEGSLDDLDAIHEGILRVKDTDSVPMIVIGNKCDLEEHRLISTSEGQKKAQRFGALFLETSAKKRINVDEAFQQLILRIVSEKAQQPISKKDEKKRSACALL